MTFTIQDNSGIVLAAKDEAIAAALEESGIFLDGEAADELENPPRRVDTGRLKNSITHTVQGHTLYVGTNVEYAGWVHDGTRHMAPNRFLANAFDRNMDQVEDRIIDRLKNA